MSGTQQRRQYSETTVFKITLKIILKTCQSELSFWNSVSNDNKQNAQNENICDVFFNTKVNFPFLSNI